MLNDRRYISEFLLDSLVDVPLSDEPSSPFEKISFREFEILMLLLEGLPLKDIAQQLNLQSSTVGTHKARVFEKPGITNRAELKDLGSKLQHLACTT